MTTDKEAAIIIDRLILHAIASGSVPPEVWLAPAIHYLLIAKSQNMDMTFASLGVMAELGIIV